MGGELAHRLIRETFALTVLLTLYLDSAPLPLGWETVYQLAAIFFVMMQAVSGTKPEWVAAKRLFDVVVGLLGAFLQIWTTVSLDQNSPDWSAFFQSLFFGFWLPLSLLPFFYVLGFYAAADKALARFRAIKRPLSPRVTAAFVIGTRLRLSLLARVNGRYSSVADASGFREGLARMRQFRDDMTRRDNEEADRLGVLASNAGMIGIEDDGLHRDRREFDVTKKRLDWIWTCHVEGLTGIEPALSAWEAEVLPLNYSPARLTAPGQHNKPGAARWAQAHLRRSAQHGIRTRRQPRGYAHLRKYAARRTRHDHMAPRCHLSVSNVIPQGDARAHHADIAS